MSTLSRRRLKEIAIEDDPPEGALPDPRQQDIGRFITVNGDVLDTVREVFQGTALADDPAKVRALLQARGQVAEAWSNAKAAYLECGRALLAVDEVLDDTERDALRRGFGRLFPFSETVASQFRQIARAVDSGRIPLEACPGSYSTAYQLALLTPAQLEIAQARGLLRPDVSRHLILAFRREIRIEPNRIRESIDMPKLRAELRRIDAEVRRGLETLATLRRRRREIRAVLAEGADS
ncbi:hypothetical protein E2C06_24000 [Dankookia rubra]|uniref:DUF3102 domain-containing protein n=1 Tax=Dankookia rubra TaxID=1442381 RepID=A0A4R5QCP7_9PROT|nr:hypothetical protein [Dankookia rubra]TDH60107.1 hypothetical protein E2C06_24000 [Dankookia rubra]